MGGGRQAAAAQIKGRKEFKTAKAQEKNISGFRISGLSLQAAYDIINNGLEIGRDLFLSMRFCGSAGRATHS